jgi:hypothetical protein
MIGQYLLSIQEPDNTTDWFVLNTNRSSYELRLGGLRITTVKSYGKAIDLNFGKAKILRAMTDDFAVYIELDNGNCLVHSDTFINADGQTSFQIRIHDNESYIDGGGLDAMFPIKSFD